MKTKQDVIAEIKEFISDLMVDCKPDLTETKAFTILVYSPEILGNDDGSWHVTFTSFEERIDAIKFARYHDHTDGFVVFLDAKYKTWKQTLATINSYSNRLITRLSAM